MAPVSEKKSWKEINKQKKKWKEEKLLKQLKKQEKLEKLKEEVVIVKENKIKNVSTVSIAVAGSILDNAQSRELSTYLAGQIARATSVFQIDEIIIFDDIVSVPEENKACVEENGELIETSHCCAKFVKILQYLECPQYLRKHIFPIHRDLQFAGLLNPLDAPHHLRENDDFLFREGITTNKPVKKANHGSFVNVGLRNEVSVDKVLPAGVRCTVKLMPHTEGSKKFKGTLVAASTPRIETGVYWGYTVRLAQSFSQIFSQCPYKRGYDLKIGTSDKGSSVDNFECPPYKHLLIVFGGLQGLETVLENDKELTENDPTKVFKYYLNTLPCQGSRTIRTEEAILISLAALRPKLNPKFKPLPFEANNWHIPKTTNNTFLNTSE